MDTLTSLSNITGGLSSFGEAAQMMQLASAYKSQAGLLDVSAKGEIAAGELSANQARIRGDKIVARVRSQFAKAGVKFTGSAADVWAEQERNVQLDVINIKLNAASRANAIGFQALQARIAAGNAKTAAWAKAGQGILKIGSGFAAQNTAGDGPMTNNPNGYDLEGSVG